MENKSASASQSSNLQLVKICKWQVQFCEGNFCAAALISFFEYLYNQNIQLYPTANRLNDGARCDRFTSIHYEYQAERVQEIADSIVNLFGHRVTAEALSYLESKHVISTHENPNPRYIFNSKKWYIFHPEPVRRWLNIFNKKLSHNS